MSGLAWYVGRLSAMSRSEIAWRAGQAADNLLCRGSLSEQTDRKVLTDSTVGWEALSRRFRDGIGRPVLLDRDRAARIAAQNSPAVHALVAEADRLVSGERNYFGYPSVNVGAVIDWNYDPIANYHWPIAPSVKINHRSAKSDPKWIWELNRLQHLPVLAEAWLFTGDARYAAVAFDHLDSWLEQNPIGVGIAWRGAFEAGIRAISVAIALQGLRTSPEMTTARYRRIVRMLDASARYCWRGRSRFSSANNHLIGELAGLATVHLLFPELAAPAALFARCLSTLADEAARQILPDGTGAEQALSYQMFTVELLATVVVLLRLRGDEPPSQLTSTLVRSSSFLSSLVQGDEPDSRYGDDDDGFTLRLGVEPKRTVRQHLSIAAAASCNVIVNGESTLNALWFSAALTDRLGQPLSPEPARTPVAALHARDGGLVVFRSGRRRLTMDVGPLGYLATAAHGHADALSITLSSEGHDLIVDPGTASYFGHPEWRDTHRGTRVHPTVCVDGLDQSVIGGPFLWSRHAQTTVHLVDLDRGIVDAEHDGYRRFDDPVTHRRLLIAPPDSRTVVVVDLIDGLSVHDVAVSWPLAPDLAVLPTRDGHLVSRDDRAVLQLCYAATSEIEAEQIRADPDSHLGWWSDRLEFRTPSWLVGARCRAAAPVEVVTLLRTADAGAISDPSIVTEGTRTTVTWFEDGVECCLTIDRVRPGELTVDGPFSRVERVVSKP